MVRRKKDQPPMKAHTIRMSDAEWAEMQRCAEIADESDSEYIRKAVEIRNMMINASTNNPLHKHGGYVTVPKLDGTHKNNTVSISEGDKFINKHTGEEYTAIQVREDDGVIVGQNEKERRAFGDKLTYNKNDLVQSFPKGGGKK